LWRRRAREKEREGIRAEEERRERANGEAGDCMSTAIKYAS